MPSLKLVVGFFLIILFFHLLASFNYWYWTLWWFDIPMHFSGGFWLAIVFFYFGRVSNLKMIVGNPEPKRLPFSFLLVLAIGFVVLGGVLWEFSEFLYDVLISSKGYWGVAQLGVADTMADLFFDFLGGLVFAVVYRVRNKNQY